MACSVCREAGHTKRNCPVVKEEYVKLQRDRTNMFIQIAPALLANPIVQGMMWWQVSKIFPATRFFNELVMGAWTADLLPFVDINMEALPQGVVFGSSLFIAENSDDYVEWLKQWRGAEGADPTTATTGTGAGGSIQGDLIIKFFNWIGTQIENPPEWAEQKTYTT